MIDGLKPYPEMKATGIEWLPALPDSWQMRRAKYSFSEIDDRSEAGGEELLSVSHKTGVTPRSQKHITMFMAESYEGHKVCRPGDIVVNTMWAWMAAVGVSHHTGIVSPAYGIYRPRSAEYFDPKYLDYLLRLEIYRAEYLRSSRGITTSRLRLYPPEFLNTPFVQPSIDEQKLIVRFLDWHGAQTAKLIRAKKRLIALLSENKQAIIHQAITGSLNSRPNAEKSNVLWFDDVPEGWKILTLRRVIHRAVDGPHHSPSYLDEGIPFLSARNIKADRWSLDDVKYISETDFNEFSRRVKPECGDVLYTKGGTTGIARAVDLDFPFQVWVHIAVLKLDRAKVYPRFLSMALNSPRCYEQSQLFTRGATNQDLGLGRMKDIFLCLPPLSEQKEIIRYCDSETRIMMDSIQRTNDEVKFIAEFRTRLNADVVTGKLDVRAAAASLPALAEAEPTDTLADDDDLDEAVDIFEDEEAAA